MSQAVWVLHLSKKADIQVKSGQQVASGDLLAVDKNQKYHSPVKAKISEINDQQIKLKFPTIKIEGQGHGRNSVWGKLVFFQDLNLTDLSAKQADNLIFTPQLSNLVLKKAKVLGVSGFITTDYDKSLNQDLPILVIDQKNKQILTEHQKENCLLNVSHNCLLIPDNED